jgi:hypothetical protein
MRCTRNDRKPSSPRPGAAPAWLLAILVLTAIACGEPGRGIVEGEITATEFIEVIVALRQAESELDRDAPPDSAAAAFARRRDEILARHGVTEAAVREFVARTHHRPDLVASIWDSINSRLRTELGDPVDERSHFEPPW